MYLISFMIAVIILSVIDLKGCFDADARCSFENYDFDWLMDFVSIVWGNIYHQILQAVRRQWVAASSLIYFCLNL